MVGQIINGYTITKEIKTGGMATVYEAEKQGFKKAFKVVRPDTADDNPILFSRFLEEIDILRSLGEHPDIVRAYDVHIHQNTTVLEMEFLDGMDFDDYIKLRAPNGIRDIKQLTNICIHILEALDYAHNCKYSDKKGILHLDVKPSNIFRTQSGFIKLLDFGIAKVVGEQANKIQGAEMVTRMTETGKSTFKGTLAYSSPEQQAGTGLTVTSDIFSFGKTLHYIATGSEDMDVDVMIEPFATIVKKCTQQKRSDRFQNCQEIIEFIFRKEDPQGKPQKRECCNPSCKKTIDEDAKFCPNCGKEQKKNDITDVIDGLLKKCPKCGMQNKVNDRFCYDCGNDIQDLSPPPAMPIQKKVCPNCGKTYKQSDKFCNYCTPITKLIIEKL